MRRSVRNPMKLLLHACCGPCSLEPTRILRAAGHDLTLYYANSNIAPAEEYAHRLGTLRTWAGGEGLPVVEGPYDPAAWEATAGRVGEAALAAADGDVLRVATHPALREARCRACYRLRFEEAAALAADDYAAALAALAALRAPIDAFFEDVLIMDDDLALRENRLRLLNRFVAVFAHVADFGKMAKGAK